MWDTLLERSFDKWSSTYDRDITKSFSRRNITYNDIWDAIAQEMPLQSGSKILEIGVGTGKVGECVRQHSVVGVDISKRMLMEARKTGAYSELIHSPARRLPFIDAYFDGIYTAFMFHSERRPDQLLEELKRVLKPGAPVVIVDLFPRGREKSRNHLLWSMLHSLRHEKLAPSFYKPLEQQKILLESHFKKCRFRYIDTSSDVPDNAPGSMSHGLLAGERE